MSAVAQTLSISEAVKLALVHCDAGRLRKAEQIYRQILGIRSNNVDLLHLLGVIALRVGKAADAVALVARATERAPNEPSYLSSLGDAHRALGRIDDAIASYRRAIEIEPDLGEALGSIGDALKERGKLDAAAASYRARSRSRRTTRKSGAISASSSKNKASSMRLPSVTGALWPSSPNWRRQATTSAARCIGGAS